MQAAINAVHADAGSVEATDWPQIVALYDRLLTVAPTPVVALNRAIAVGEDDGPAAALRWSMTSISTATTRSTPARADLLRRLHRPDEAINAYERAASLAPTGAERDFLAGQAGQLSSSDG